MNRLRTSESGFTLIEMLVAMAILTLSLVAIYRAFATGLTLSDRGSETALMALEARSLMAEIGVSIPIEETPAPVPLGESRQWQMTAEIIDDPFGRGPVSGVWRIYEITLVGTTPRGHKRIFRTRRIAK